MPITGGSGSASSSFAMTPSLVRVATTAGTNSQVLKTGACTVSSYQFFNKSVVPRYVRLYDIATAPDPATSPVSIGPIPVPPNTDVRSPGGMSLRFASGLAITVTGASGDGDVMPIDAGDVNGFVGVL